MTTEKRFKLRFRSVLASIALTAANSALAANSPVMPGNDGDRAAAPAMHEKGTNSAGVRFQVDVLGVGGTVADVPVVGPLVYDQLTGPPTITLETAENVLCLQGSAQQGLALEITDSNGVTNFFQGFKSVVYYSLAQAPVAGLSLKVETDADPQCAAVSTIVHTVTTGAPPVECSVSEIVFGDGFESPTAGSSGVNLRVDFRLLQHPDTSTGAGAVYEIHVTNCGEATATKVGVTDFFPTAQAPGPALQFGTWTCPGSCGGYINRVYSSIGPGESRVTTATRPLQAGSAGEMIRVSAAAISLTDIPDDQPDDNTGSWEFEIRANEPPTVTVAGTADSLAEDDGTVTLTGVTIAAADSDGSITSVAVNSLSISILTIDSVDDADPAKVLVDVTTVADAFGTATLEVVATDNLGGTSTPVTFDVVVDPVNDPPTIAVLGGFDYNDRVPLFAGPNCTQASAPGCADQNYPSDVGVFQADYLDWVVQVTPGPANESAQTATVSIGPPSDPGLFVGAAFQPALIDQGGTWDLEYALIGDSGIATMTITVDDGEVVNNLTTLSFDIFVDNGPPSVTAGQSFLIAENSANASTAGTVVGTDPEMDVLRDWTIVAGNTDVDQDTNPALSIEPASGVLSVNDAEDLDFENTPSFTLSVIVSDGTSTSAPQDVIVNLSDVNDNAPVVTPGLVFQIPENSSVCIPECRLTATDADAVGSLQGWSIVSGNIDVDLDMSLPFAIVDDNGDGVIIVNDIDDMDFETNPSFSLMVTVGDGENTSAQGLVRINLIDVAD